MVGHKVVIPDVLTEQELALQEQRRVDRISEFIDFFNVLSNQGDEEAVREKLLAVAGEMNLDVIFEGNRVADIQTRVVSVKTKPAPKRNKKIKYEASQLPRLDKAKEYSSDSVVTSAMQVFARDPRVVSVDADLGKVSGLEAGVGYVDMSRSFNVGIAESNMMNIGEAYAVMGYNTWVSTFCPFFDWRVLRRIAVGYQERSEAMAIKDWWLSEGHGLDLTFLATAPNFETNTNGATHMGNDDIQVFDGIAHLKIIDISCPHQLLAAMKWIMEGNRGLVYLRVMRAPSGVIYGSDFQFEFGKGYILKESRDDKAVIVSSGRGVHEALATARELEQSGIRVGVVDMPSIDEPLLFNLHDSGKLVIIAEQNNGYIWSEYRKALFKAKETIDTTRVVPINALDSAGRPQFIHSATYPQLLHRFGLAPGQIAATIRQRIGAR